MIANKPKDEKAIGMYPGDPKVKKASTDFTITQVKEQVKMVQVPCSTWVATLSSSAISTMTVTR